MSKQPVDEWTYPGRRAPVPVLQRGGQARVGGGASPGTLVHWYIMSKLRSSGGGTKWGWRAARFGHIRSDNLDPRPYNCQLTVPTVT
jgi:hypothetical protein